MVEKDPAPLCSRSAVPVLCLEPERAVDLAEPGEDARGQAVRVELAALLAFGAGELGEEVLVDAAQCVF